MARFLLAALCVLALWPMVGYAEHARIELTISRIIPATGNSVAETSAFADTDPPLGGFTPRPLFKVKMNDPLALQFILTNTYPHGVKKNVTVRYFVVPEKKARQKEMPDLTTGVVTQGSFKLNFKPDCRVGARVMFTLTQKGIYLLRVETQNTDSDHEHFSAIDILAE